MNLMPRVLLATSIAAMSSTAATAAAPLIATASPLIGTWALDTSRLPMPPDQRPKSVSFTFAEAGGGKWVTHVDIVYASGQQVHSVSTAPLDGTYAVIVSSPEADHIALEKPVSNVVVTALQQNGVLVSTRIYSVTPDGHNLVETVVYPGSDNKRVMRANYFERVP